ncbi:plasmid pRiA4b ORF-3 family protein [Ureibacillus sp. MALMAid1270]|uniref:plasmid pRiA4b ORF-3 family protein n=1 Tax=Ureibacillus sp. MALMAid1270 TaxID=3411629 RepID=UPI003BA4B9BE
MIIHCTKKLLDQLKKEPMLVDEENPLMSWHANLLTINRRKTVVLVNDKNRYVIVLHGLKAKDFNNLNEIVIQSIRSAFESEGIKIDAIEQYIQSSNEITYTKTSDRKLVARMNRACETLYLFENLLDSETIFQPTLSLRLSRDLVGDGKKSYFHPNEMMYMDLEEFVGSSVFQTNALELRITLRLNNFKVFRKILVPSNYTFRNLHNVIQTAFGWQDCHLYEFYIYNKCPSNNLYHPNHPAYAGKEYYPILNLVCDEEIFSYGSKDIPMKMDTSVKLAEYMPTKVIYIYDFGDNWTHDIEVERVIENYEFNFASCIDGEGTTPPEDIGGEGGYEEFIKILSDQNHPDYEHIKNWSSYQVNRDFDINRVNRLLKKSLY